MSSCLPCPSPTECPCVSWGSQRVSTWQLAVASHPHPDARGHRVPGAAVSAHGDNLCLGPMTVCA